MSGKEDCGKNRERKGNMKVLAFNSSPKMGKGNTALILNPFLDGMKEAGAEVELLYVRKLKINPCRGEFNCWTKNPGRCYQKDDMNMLLPKLMEADIRVLATPVYVDGISGPMKNLIDRMIPLAQQSFEIRGEHTRHPRRPGYKIGGKVVLVSTCGLWEMDNFDPLIVHMKAICKNWAKEFAGALLRPHAGGLRAMMNMRLPMDDIFEAAKEAGRQLVETGEMSPGTLQIVSRELMSRDVFILFHNRGFARIVEAVAPS